MATAVAVPAQSRADEPGGPANMDAFLSTRSLTHLPVDYGTVQASTVFTGSHGWGMYLTNRTGATVNNPKFTIDSGYQPGGSNSFLWRTSSTPDNQWQAIESFPATAPNNSAGTLANGQGMVTPPVDYSLVSDLPVTFKTGFDFTKTVTGDIVSAADGGEETVTVSFTPRDPAFGTASPNQVVSFSVLVGDEQLSGLTFSDEHLPTLPDGSDENASWALNPTSKPNTAVLQVSGSSLQIGYTYQASVVVHVPPVTLDAGLYLPEGKYRYVPVIHVGASVSERGTLTPAGTSVTIHDPLLDGGVAGRGGVTFSINESSYPWTPRQGYTAEIEFEGLRAPSCPMGGCPTAVPSVAASPSTLVTASMFATDLPVAPTGLQGATNKKNCQVMHHTTTRNDATPFVLDWVSPKKVQRAIANGDILLTSC